MIRKWALLGLALGVCGCQSMNHTEKGLVTGGVLGTGLGAVIGGLAGDSGAGAAIGAFTGLLAGGLAGSAADEREERDARARAIAAAEQNPPVPLHEVVRMAQQHFNDDLIIAQIRSTGSTYNLSVSDMEYLSSQGVSQRVIHEMVNRRAVVVQPAVREVIVAEPPPPHIHVGYGYGYGYRRCRN